MASPAAPRLRLMTCCGVFVCARYNTVSSDDPIPFGISTPGRARGGKLASVADSSYLQIYKQEASVSSKST
jgi:hypothetical protein